jgi:hypothetical protein
MITITIARDGQQDFHVKLQSGDSYVFKSLIDALKNFVSPVYRKYEPNARKWVVGEPATESFRGWLAYARTTFNARIEWSGEAYADPEAEWTPPPPPRPPRSKALDPHATLWLLPGAPPELVRAAFKCLATLFHPDKPGGDEERMKAINRAYEKLAA